MTSLTKALARRTIIRRCAPIYLTAILTLLLGSCTSLGVRLDRLVGGEHFAAALILLEEEGAGRAVSPSVDAEALQAGEAYTSAYEAYLTKKINTAVEARLARKALHTSGEFLTLCPWSRSLADRRDVLQKKVERLDI